ncbi:cation:dicarboxylate symporter family transporter [Serratia proteamaculans]|uniref:cation:dicarboxylate symporter family transporter n=1 Tax=Serratia proteamaculans TaxID=28151 RepID=UPI0021797D9C|nr:cation:dicarboxylase symporter family transporter [Serratia proteamaculans]CAI0991604.1 Na(+)/serine-threonine symporter [Serratia proteamaculans]
MQKLLQKITQGSLVKQIMVGLVAGIIVALVSPATASAVGLLGALFVGALKAVAPVLVLVLVMASIANHKHGQKTNIRPILFLYLLGTFAAALVAVVVSFMFPSNLALVAGNADINPPGGIIEVLKGLLLSVVAAVCACGASGVAGGSLLLIPLACNMFGIPNDVAMQVVAVGFIIGVLQDSAETALNSSTDVLFTAAACQAEDQRLADEDPLKVR